jgi:hypothetical protein
MSTWTVEFDRDTKVISLHGETAPVMRMDDRSRVDGGDAPEKPTRYMIRNIENVVRDFATRERTSDDIAKFLGEQEHRIKQVLYHGASLGLPIPPKARRIEWQAFVEALSGNKVGVPEAAERMGKSRATVRDHIKKGIIPGAVLETGEYKKCYTYEYVVREKEGERHDLSEEVIEAIHAALDRGATSTVLVDALRKLPEDVDESTANDAIDLSTVATDGLHRTEDTLDLSKGRDDESSGEWTKDLKAAKKTLDLDVFAAHEPYEKLETLRDIVLIGVALQHPEVSEEARRVREELKTLMESMPK